MRAQFQSGRVQPHSQTLHEAGKVWFGQTR